MAKPTTDTVADLAAVRETVRATLDRIDAELEGLERGSCVMTGQLQRLRDEFFELNDRALALVHRSVECYTVLATIDQGLNEGLEAARPHVSG
ncbi:hypothetical protein WJX84_008163 [Apatococcus fuscideae]|uniref:WXG100 family type VII secretion target n=1 Tax=Apatococcus fuscideae TaxID=2026836 RepID=A0AAW1T7N4_9CHLO